MTLSEYAKLKQQIVLSVDKSEKQSYLLNTFKQFFKDDINSPRRIEVINSITNLLEILEKRDVLSEDNVTPLKEIAKKIPDKRELLNKIQEYEQSHVSRELYNNNYGITELNEPQRNLENVHRNSYFPGNMSNKKQSRIHDKIVDEIGTYWRDLGRNLKIRECDIDEIDRNNHTLSEKAKKILEKYYHKIADPQRSFFDLCDALEKARRRDISKSLQEIMVMNI